MMKNAPAWLIVAIVLMVLFLALFSVNDRHRQGEGDRSSDQSAAVLDRDRTPAVPVAEVEPQVADRDAPPAAQAGRDAVASLVKDLKGGTSDGRHAVKKVVTQAWLDPEAKSERRRVRVVEADFKYPRLKLEEIVSTDPATGEDEVIPVRASVADHVMVGLKAGVDVAEAKRQIERQGYQIRAEEVGSYLLVALPDHEDAGAQDKHIATIQQIEGIDYAEPDWLVYHSVLPNDPALADGVLWGLNNPGNVAGTVADADIDAPEAWAVRAEVPDVVVAVTDTGIRHTHEDLAANMWTNGQGHHGYDAYDLDNDPMDSDGHGTHVAGTIGAVGNNGLGLTGVAWNVKLMALRFIGLYGGATSDAITVINYAMGNGADVISASWGGAGESQSLENAIRACHSAGIPFVAAAGNLNMNNDSVPHYPSSFRVPNIVSVAATDANDLLASFSNYGRSSVDVAAPGDNIWSCGIASDSDYRYLSGTSMAAPHVAGALALARAHFPGESCEDLITRLYRSVDKPVSIRNRVATSGRLNVHKLLVASDPMPPHNHFNTALWYWTRYWDWSGSNARMTQEDDEEVLNSGLGTRSMWFFWTAPADGLARIKAEAELGDLILEVYKGNTRTGRQLIRDNLNERPTRTSEFYFNASKGQTYSICMDSAHPLPQQMGIQTWLYPVNDMFDHAIDLGSGTRIAGSGDNTGASTETFEMNMRHGGRRADRSIWWKWTPDFSGPFVLGTQRSEIDTVLAVYTGTKGNLVEVASNDDVSAQDWTSQVTMNVASGTTYHIVVDSYSSNSVGKIELDGYRPDELFILKQPQGVSVKVGGEATFRVAAAGTDLRYQWEFNGQPIPGAIRTSHTVQGVLPQDYGSYRVRISNLANQIYSNSVTLSEIATMPRIVWQSRSLNASAGETVNLLVEVTGSEPMTYQWYKGDVPIPGANGKKLELTNVNAANEGTYRFTAANALGSVPSSPMLLSVYSSPWESWQHLDQANQTGAVFGIVYQGGQWVAASRAYPGTRISISQDGRNWKHRIVNPLTPVSSCSGSFLVYGNGIWLFGGQGQSNSSTIGVVYKSTDLINWQQINIGIPLYSHKMVFHDGAFFLMNGNDTTYTRIYRSLDGVTWQKQFRQAGTEIVVRLGMASSPHGLLVCGNMNNSNESAFFLPTSSTVWQAINIDPARTELSDAVFWFKDRYIASASGIYESLNGVNWSGPLATASQRYPGYPIYQSWLVEHGNHVYGNSNGPITSLDGGLTWTTNSSFYPLETQAGASNGSLLVFGTNKGGLFATENPGNTKYAVPMMNSIQDMRYEGRQFIISQTPPTYDGTGAFARFTVSADSETWNTYSLLRIDNTAGTYGGFNVKWINGEFWKDGRYIPSGSGTENFFRGPVPSSTWEAVVPDLAGTYLVDYAEGPAGILAVRISGANTYGDLVKSTDGGSTWTAVSPPGGAPSKYSKIECLGGVYVHTSSVFAIHVSADLVNWTSLGYIDYITKHNGLYRAWSSGSFMTSSDMLNWSAWTIVSSRTMSKPVSFGGAMVCVSSNRLQYSYDGINWVPSDVGFIPKYLASTGDVLLVAGSGGQLVRAGSVTNLAPVVSIVEPLAGSMSVEGGKVKVSVNSFNANQVGHPTVKVFGDGQLVGEKSTPPYEFELPISKAGGHLVHVESRQGTGPVARDHRHIKVVSATSANSYRGVSGTGLLPGSVRYLNGAYFSSGRVDGGSVGRSSLVMMSHDLESWIPVSKLGMTKAVFGNNRLLSMENDGVTTTTNTQVAVTSDGVNWLKVQLPSAAITPLYFSHGHFWAMAQSGVMFSEDGINWSFRGFRVAPGGSSTVSFIDPVGDPNGIMIALVLNNGIWRTTDGGANWSRILQNLSSPSVPVIDGNDFFVWGSIGGIGNFGSSVDGGANWSFAPSPSLSLTMVNRVVFAFGSFNRLVAVSQDGVNWHNFDVPWKMGSIIVGEDGYFHVQVTESGVEGIYRSADGIDWQKEADSPTTGSFSLFDSPDGLFATTSNGGLWRLRRESDEWEVVAEPVFSSVTFKRIAGEGDRFVAMASQLIFTSDDKGQSWQKTFDPAGTALASIQFTDLFYRNGVWLAWDDGFALLRSTDGVTFTNITSAAGAAAFEVIAPGAGGWLAIKGDGSVWSSLDGLSWTSHAAAGSYPDADVVMLRELNGQWFALSVNAANTSWEKTRLLVSTNGQSWQTTNMPNLNSGMMLCGTNGILMAGDVSAQRYSSNLTSWSNTFANPSIFAGPDAFYLIRNGWLERSVTGTNWVQHRQIDVIYSAGQFVDGSIFLVGQDRITRIPVADVRVKRVNMTAGVFAVKDTIAFSMELVNTGTSVLAAKKYPVDVFLSLDGYHGDEDDSRLGKAMVDVPEIQPGASAAVTVSARIPNRVSPGAFRISVVFDRERAAYEISAANNFCMSDEILVTIPAWTLTTNSNGQGGVNQDSNQRLFAHGSMVSLIATAGKGAAFTGWGGDAVGTESQISVLMNGNKTVQANFTSRHSLQVYVEGAGEVTGLADQGGYAPGASANLTAVAANGWVFAGWSGAATGNIPSANITMDGSKALTATFKLPLNNWRPMHFSSSELTNNSISGDDADPDGDGLKNWQEYLHGSNPRNKTSKGRNQEGLEEGFLSVIHTRLSGPQSDMSVRCVGSRDLQQWNAPDIEERVLNAENGIETVETRIPVAGNDRGFLRFNYVR